MPILVFLGLSVLDLGPIYTTDRQTSDVRQTDVRQHHRFMPPPGTGHNYQIVLFRKQLKMPPLHIAL